VSRTNATWRLLTVPPAQNISAGGSSAVALAPIAIIELAAESPHDLDAALAHANIATIDIGKVSLRSLLGIDDGLIARWSPTCVHLMCHGGSMIIRRIIAALENLGIHAAGPRWSNDSVPPPETLRELMLDALSAAASPRAVDLLLVQPQRWHAALAHNPASATSSTPEHAAALDLIRDRLFHPPLVALVGPANIGKSTLVNTLARRIVSVVADEPGTTRDHVGVTLIVDGLAIRFADTPGLRDVPNAAAPGPTREHAQIEREAIAHAAPVIAAADLILLCGDRTAPPPSLAFTPRQSLRLVLRSDLGTAPFPHDLAVSAARSENIDTLATLIRRALLPDAALSDPSPWRFWRTLT
jgi:hypothetical protein